MADVFWPGSQASTRFDVAIASRFARTIYVLRCGNDRMFSWDSRHFVEFAKRALPEFSIVFAKEKELTFILVNSKFWYQLKILKFLKCRKIIKVFQTDCFQESPKWQRNLLIFFAVVAFVVIAEKTFFELFMLSNDNDKHILKSGQHG